MRRLDSNSNAPSLSTIRCFRGTIRLLRGGEINEEIAMIPSAWITKGRCPWDDDLTDSLPSKVSVVWKTRQQKEQYAHAVSLEKLADVGVDGMVVWHAR